MRQFSIYMTIAVTMFIAGFVGGNYKPEIPRDLRMARQKDIFGLGHPLPSESIKEFIQRMVDEGRIHSVPAR